MPSGSPKSSRWPYHLTNPMASKANSIIGTPKGYSYELAGFDGSIRGELRPISGFKQVYELDCTGDANHDETSEVTDFFPVDFRVGSSDYAYGFVYRVKRPATPTVSDVFIDYWDSDTSSWNPGVKIMDSVDAARQMDVAVYGRFVFVFVEGRSPALFHLVGRESPFTEQVLGQNADTAPWPGPGKQPTLVEDSKFDGDVMSPAEPSDQDVAGVAQFYLSPQLPSAMDIFMTDEVVSDGAFSDWDESAYSGSDSQCPVRIADLDDHARLLEPGDYGISYFLFNSDTGRRSAWSEIAPLRDEDFDLTVGDDTVSTKQYGYLEIAYDSSKWNQAFIYRTVKTQDAGGVYIAGIHHLEKIIDLDCYHTLKNQPGQDFDPAATDWRQSAYVYGLEDKELVMQPIYLDAAFFDERMPYGGTAVSHDGTLMVSKIDNQPKSTAIENRSEDASRGLGELRWSVLTSSSVELFPPGNRYVPNTPSNQIIRLLRVGNATIGFSEDRIYHIRRSSGFIKVEEIHEGFGTVAPKTTSTVGGQAYFVTTKGLKAVTSGGELDDVSHLDHLLVRTWEDSRADISVSYDPYMSALVVHNPTEEKSVLMWFSTGAITEVHHANMLEVRTGSWPTAFDDSSDYENSLVPRALWVQNHPDPANAPSTWKPRILMLDYERRKVISGGTYNNGNPRLATMDVGGDLWWEVLSSTSTTLTLSRGAQTTGANWVGAKVVVIKASNPDLVGLSSTISDHTSTVLTMVDDTLDDLQVGDTVVVSPVICRWIGSPLTQSTEQGVIFGNDLHRVKNVDTLGLQFTQAEHGYLYQSNLGNPNLHRTFRGLVFNGTDDVDFQTWAWPVTRDGEIAGMNDLNSDGPSAENYVAFGGSNNVLTKKSHGYRGVTLVPGALLYCGDWDFRLVSAVAHGSVESTDRRI